MPASYGRCLAYYNSTSPISNLSSYQSACGGSATLNASGTIFVAKLLGNDFLSIQAAWNGIMQDSWISLFSHGCAGYPDCPFWSNALCPIYTATNVDLPNGWNDNVICKIGMLPANFGPIQFGNSNMKGYICEFGNENFLYFFNNF